MSGELPQRIFQCEFYLKFKRCPTSCTIAKHWSSDCYECKGDIDPECVLCKGSGHVTHQGCPRSAARDIQSLLPYFFIWRAHKCTVWPDGRAMVYQPIKLNQAFQLLSWYFLSKEKKEAEKNKETGKK
jgi:hypothetical protein